MGWVGDSDVNGGWPPHTHFQVSLFSVFKKKAYFNFAEPIVCNR